MALVTLLLCAFSLALLSHGGPEAFEGHNFSGFLCTCNRIEAVISSASHVFFPRKQVVLSF